MASDNNKSRVAAATELRRQAEERLQAKATAPHPVWTNAEAQRLVHELEVHQVELEMQNEELSRARDEVGTALDNYTDLYDFAPVGYLTLDFEGAITAANLTVAGLLGIERSRLLGRRFGLLVAVESRLLFSEFLSKVFTSQGQESCEVPLPTEGNAPLFVRIEGVACASGRECRVAVIDITERRRMEARTEHLASFPQMNPNPVLEVDAAGRITFCNPATVETLQTLGMDAVEVALFLPADMEGILASWDRLHEATLHREIHIKDSDFGETIFLSPKFHIARIYTYDITARKHAEEKLQKAHDELEVKIRERTKALLRTNENLLHEVDERKKAEESLHSAYAEIRLLKDRLQAENVYLQKEIAQRYNYGEIIGRSDAISQVFQRVEQVAPMQATVLILGETGTGKGVVARAIHSTSVRKDRPMITVNCTALPANLIESELFGRERGAFTGADARQLGRFELADHGTIFLDEIGEMPLELQPKLLRVIQDGEFERLGSPRTIKVDVRIIAASNRNLEEEIKNGRFREDLFYRLNVFPIALPPLRQREGDIELLINHFVAKFNKKTGKRIETISSETLKALREYHWPGNVRELESVIERAVITSQGSVLQVLDRFDTFRKGELAGEEVKGLVELEHDHILQVLLKTNWRVEGKRGAALLLGINPSTLRARMRKYGIARHQMNDMQD